MVARLPRVALGAGALALAVTAVAASGQALPPRGTPSVSLGCSASVYGPLGPAALRPSQRTLAAASITWPQLRAYAASLPRARFSWPGGLGLAVKALAVVGRGTVVRVVVPPGERRLLSLYYVRADPRRQTAAGDLYRVADGERQVTFHACAGGQGGGAGTQFAGYFVAAAARCARIDIYAGATGPPLERRIPFGVPAHSCPAIG
jgi:hypothetical protein